MFIENKANFRMSLHILRMPFSIYFKLYTFLKMVVCLPFGEILIVNAGVAQLKACPKVGISCAHGA
jgi:hypothetical protein